MLIGIALDHEIGVDVECVRPVSGLDCLTDGFFAPGEAAAIRALPGEQRLSAFFACWTRKEAFVKAIGAGLGHPLDAFEVSSDPHGHAQLIQVDGSVDKAAGWTMRRSYRLMRRSRPPSPLARQRTRISPICCSGSSTG